MNDSEFNALLKLLSDPDEFVSESAKKKLIDEFDNIEKKFNEIIADSNNNSFIEKANEISREYYFLSTKKELYDWKKQKNKDLLRGLYIITKIFKNNLDYQQIYNFFENIKRKLYFNIDNYSPLEQIRTINALLFKELKTKITFKEENFNSLFIDYFLKNKKTSAFLITIIYYIIAQKLDIPIIWIRNQEINLLTLTTNPISHTQERFLYQIDYQFFINPSDKGYIFTYEEFKYSLNTKDNKRIENFIITNNSEILKIFISHLMIVAKKNNLLNIMDYLVILHKILT